MLGAGPQNLLRRFTVLVLAWIVVGPALVSGQELEPRAYLTLPVGANLLVTGYARSSGNVLFDPSLGAEDVSARVNTSFIGYGRALDFFGRSASVSVTLPYVWGDITGKLEGEPAALRRSGLRDPRFRLAVNLIGGPALTPREFARYRQKTNIGVSLLVIAPLGQYDPAKLINLSSHRWSFKPEVGFSQALGKWHLDLYAGVWLFSKNDNFFGGSTREQNAIGVTQGHISYTFRPSLWAALDGTFYTGGRTFVDGQGRADLQKNSRIGFTVSLPLAGQHSIKLHTGTGAFTTVGADFDAFSVAYQYVWF
jgi:hypothetical protein